MLKKVAIAMSGGVDSSAAVYLLKEQGYDCAGITLKLFEKDDRDIQDAKSVAETLGIPHYTLDLTGEFQQRVIDYFIRSYERGHTPNPCVECNRNIKFGRLYEYAQELGYSYVATGHYARVEFDTFRKKYLLKKGVNQQKDQSYVLFGLTQELLARTLFPLGDFSKAEVREISSSQNFRNAQKPESQDICFIPEGDYAGYIANLTGKTYSSGDFVDSDGKILGRHKGIIHYTLGQRKGLGISFPQPMYVCGISPESNTVRLGLSSELFSRTLLATGFNWVLGETPKTPVRIKAKIRYRQKEEDAIAELIDDTTVQVTFDAPQRAITPGQIVVLYHDDIVVGGGTIC